MDLNGLSLPDWLPWWAVVALLAPAALYGALFLLMPFQTFGLRARLRDLELNIEALHEEIRGLTLRLPDRGLDGFGDLPAMAQPPIPPAPRQPPGRDAPVRDGTREPPPRGGFGDPVADRMLAYMREKAQTDLQRADMQRGEPRPAPRPRAEPRFAPPEPPREPDLPPPPAVGGPGTGLPGGPPDEGEYPPEAAPPPRAPRVPSRFGRRSEPDEGRSDWPR